MAHAAEKQSATKIKETTTALKEQQATLEATAQKARQVADSSGAGNVAGFRANGGIAGMRNDWQQVSNSVRNAGDGGPQGVASLQASAEAAERLQTHLTGARNAAVAATVAGVGLANVAKGWRQAAEEGAGPEARLEAVFKSQNRSGDIEQVNKVIQDVTVRGHFADDDPLRQSVALMANWEVKTKDMNGLLESAGRQSQLTGQSVEEMANSFGKAVATGNFEGLKRSAVSFSEVEIASIKAGYALSQEAGQAALVSSINAAVARTTGELGSGLTEQAKASADAARAMDDFKTSAGQGAQFIHGFGVAVGGSLLRMANGVPYLAQMTGGLVELGGGLFTSIGGMIAFGAQTMSLVNGFRAFQLAAVAAKEAKAVAEALDAAATTANTGATVANTGASVAATGAQAAQTVATEADAIATTELAVAEGAAAAGAAAEALGATAAAGATGTAGVAAAGAATGFWAMAAGVWAVIAPFAVLIGVALAAAAAIAIAAYSWNVNKDKLLNPTSSTEDNRTDEQKGQDVQTEGQLDELRVKAEKLQGKDKYATLNALAQKYIDLNQGDKASEVQAEASEARKGLTGSSKELQTPDSAEAKALLAQIQGQKADANRAAQLDGSNFHGFEKHDFWGNVVPNDASATGAPDAASLKAQADAAAAQAKAAQSAPLPAAPKALPASLSAPVSVLTAPGGGFSAGGTEDEKNPYEEQIRALQRQKRDLKGKTNAAARDELQKQIDALTDASRSWKESHASQMKATREQTSANKKATRAAEQEAKKAEREDEKLANIDAKDDVSILKAQHDEDRADQIAALQDQLDEAKEQRNVARVRALTLQIEKAKAEQKYDDAMAQAASQTDTPHRQALEQIAALRLRADERRAERAATKAVNEVNKSGESEREKTESDAAVRAQLAMRSNANSAFYTGRPIAAMMAPPVDLSAPSVPVAAQSEEGRAWNAEVRARPRLSQNPNGTIRLILDEEIPYQGVGGMR